MYIRTYNLGSSGLELNYEHVNSAANNPRLCGKCGAVCEVRICDPQPTYYLMCVEGHHQRWSETTKRERKARDF